VGFWGSPQSTWVPTCGYEVGNCTIDRDGAVETEDEKTAEMVRAGLLEQGLIESPQAEVEGMTAEGLKNLIYFIHSKQYLINRAFSEEVFRIPAALVEELGGVSDTEAFLQAFESHADECKGIGFLDGKAACTEVESYERMVI